MKDQIKDCKKSEPLAQEVVVATLMQLETARKMVDTLRSDGSKTIQAYDAMASQLEKSRAQAKFLENLVSNLKITVEEIKSASGRREAELEAELRKSKYEIEELRSNLIDKETELQYILEENNGLIMRLENLLSGQREREMEREIENLKARLAELSNVYEENEILKVELVEGKVRWDELKNDVDRARAAEREAVMKAGRVGEQLEAAQVANAEMEGEMRRLKVRCDQWRKAAEAAACIVLGGHEHDGGVIERAGSTERSYGFYGDDDLDEGLLKKKKASVLRRFGVLCKKSQR